jgi:hypothetical protein
MRFVFLMGVNSRGSALYCRLLEDHKLRGCLAVILGKIITQLFIQFEMRMKSV